VHLTWRANGEALSHERALREEFERLHAIRVDHRGHHDYGHSAAPVSPATVGANDQRKLATANFDDDACESRSRNDVLVRESGRPQRRVGATDGRQ